MAKRSKNHRQKPRPRRSRARRPVLQSLGRVERAEYHLQFRGDKGRFVKRSYAARWPKRIKGTLLFKRAKPIQEFRGFLSDERLLLATTPEIFRQIVSAGDRQTGFTPLYHKNLANLCRALNRIVNRTCKGERYVRLLVNVNGSQTSIGLTVGKNNWRRIMAAILKRFNKLKSDEPFYPSGEESAHVYKNFRIKSASYKII